MEYYGRIHARIVRGASIEDRHGSLVDFLHGLTGPWQLKERIPSVVPDDYDVSWTKSLNKHLPKGLSLRGVYMRRVEEVWADDDSAMDDGLNIGLSKKSDVSSFASEVMPGLIRSFGAYYGYFGSEAYESWVSEHGWGDPGCRSDNLRHEVPGAYLINYWDGELCSRAFGLTCAEVIARSAGMSAVGSMIGNGVYLNAFRAGMSLQEEIDTCARIISELRRKARK